LLPISADFVILSGVSYVGETLSLVVRDEHGLSFCGQGLTGNSRKLYNEELNSLYAPNIICTIESRRYAKHVTLMEENSYLRYVFQSKLRNLITLLTYSISRRGSQVITCHMINNVSCTQVPCVRLLNMTLAMQLKSFLRRFF
jgi:hypothetical protein